MNNPKPKTLFDKIWHQHLVHQQEDETCPNFSTGNLKFLSLTKCEPSGIEVFLSTGTRPIICSLLFSIKAFLFKDLLPIKSFFSLSTNPKLGHVSASCWSVENDNPFSLAILKDGKNKIGEKLYAVSPLKNISIQVEVVSQHYVDPDGKRVRS